MSVRVLVTGADGFVGRNLALWLAGRAGFEVIPFVRGDVADDLRGLVARADAVVHLAGVNRPRDAREFEEGNTRLTVALAEALSAQASDGRQLPVIFSSSIQAAADNPYGRSKRAAEAALQDAAQVHGFALHVFRLPNVFGKWSRPDYNSVVATFCHRVSRGLPVEVHDASAALRLVYVDDVLQAFTRILETGESQRDSNGFAVVQPEYTTTVGALAQTLQQFQTGRTTLEIAGVGQGLVRALYATYVSFLPPQAFAYPLNAHADSRGRFVEVLKTRDSGQFSFFTAGPGVTRGGHYHHTKTEKFLVLSGRARFRFRHLVTDERHELFANGEQPEVVETIPGWTHDITNIGDCELVVMLWANEVFDRDRPDTFACKL